MLRKEEEFEQNGSMAGQKLADELHGVRGFTENALPATALHQTFRGSGFRRGRVIPRGWGSRSDAFGTQNVGRGRMNLQSGQSFSRGMHTTRGNSEQEGGKEFSV